jgi:hypothetical protein
MTKAKDVSSFGEVLARLGNFVNLTIYVDAEGQYTAALGCKFDDTLEEESEHYMMALGYGVLASLNGDGDHMAELGMAMMMGMAAGSEEDDGIFFTPEEEKGTPEKSKDGKVLSFKPKGTKTRH